MSLRSLTNAQLREAYHDTRALQANASRMNRANGVFAMERKLEAIWAEADRRHIALLRPELDPPEPATESSERASDLVHDGHGIRARGGLVYFG